MAPTLTFGVGVTWGMSMDFGCDDEWKRKLEITVIQNSNTVC